MSIRDVTRVEHARIGALLTDLARGGSWSEPAFFELMEQLTAHLATHYTVVLPAVRSAIGVGALQTEMQQLDARMRALVMRMGALWKLGSTKFDVPLSDLLVVFRTHVVFEEEQVVPALERAMSDDELIALERAMADEHRVVASAFRELTRQPRSAA